MNERRNSYPILLPAGKRWKALFGFIGVSGFITMATLLLGGGRMLEKADAIQRQLTTMQQQHAAELVAQGKLNGEFRGRIAELTTSENQLRALLNLPPLVHQSILDGGSESKGNLPTKRDETQQAILPVVQRRAVR
jgi:hypothetical protein